MLIHNTLRYFNSHPHEEDDHTEQKVVLCVSYFNSHPHEEDDDRDRIRKQQ